MSSVVCGSVESRSIGDGALGLQICEIKDAYNITHRISLAFKKARVVAIGWPE